MWLFITAHNSHTMFGSAFLFLTSSYFISPCFDPKVSVRTDFFMHTSNLFLLQCHWPVHLSSDGKKEINSIYVPNRMQKKFSYLYSTTLSPWYVVWMFEVLCFWKAIICAWKDLEDNVMGGNKYFLSSPKSIPLKPI